VKLAENVHCRRLVAARLHQQPRSLFNSKAERLAWKETRMSFTSCSRSSRRRTATAQAATPASSRSPPFAVATPVSMAILEWVDLPAEVAGASAPVAESATKADETAKG
jgi:hypothetical protein